jgi:hypothetical protein
MNLKTQYPCLLVGNGQHKALYIYIYNKEEEVENGEEKISIIIF